MAVKPRENSAGIEVETPHIVVPAMIVIELRNGLVFGKLGYVDGTAVSV